MKYLFTSVSQILDINWASNNKTFHLGEYQTFTSMQYKENDFCVLLRTWEMNVERERPLSTGIKNWISI